MILRVIDSRKKLKKPCDLCQRSQGDTLECFLPYGTRTGRPDGSGQWRDLCDACRKAILEHFKPYVDLATPLHLETLGHGGSSSCRACQEEAAPVD